MFSLSSEFPLRLCLSVYGFALIGVLIFKVNFARIKADTHFFK